MNPSVSEESFQHSEYSPEVLTQEEEREALEGRGVFALPEARVDKEVLPVPRTVTAATTREEPASRLGKGEEGISGEALVGTPSPAPSARSLGKQAISTVRPTQPLSPLRGQRPRPDATAITYTDLSHAQGFVNAQDHPEPQRLVVVDGEIPAWLNGDIFTVGPGTFDVRYPKQGELEMETRTYSVGHWMDGLPLVQKMQIDGRRNAVHYRSRLTARRLAEKIRDHHGYLAPRPHSLYRTDSNQSALASLLRPSAKSSRGGGKGIKPEMEACGAAVHAAFPGTDGVCVQGHANTMQVLDYTTLLPKTLKVWDDWADAEVARKRCTSTQVAPLSRRCPGSGEVIMVAMEPGYGSTDFHVTSILEGAPGGEVVATVNVPAISILQSFSLTPRYIILAIHPFKHAFGGLKYFWGVSLLDALTFDGASPTMFYVVSRMEKKIVAVYQSDASFALHHINAYEDPVGDRLVVDLAAYADDTILRGLELSRLRDPRTMAALPLPEYRRYELTRLQEEEVRYTTIEPRHYRPATSSYLRLAEVGVEFPQIAGSRDGLRHRWVWGLGMSAGDGREEGRIWDAVVKMDGRTGATVAYWRDEGCYPGEALFVPNPEAVREQGLEGLGEDYGVLLTVVYDARVDGSFLLILDARNCRPLARIKLPSRVPPSLGHGLFIPG